MTLAAAAIAWSSLASPATVAHVAAEARVYGVPPALCVAVCLVESGCRGIRPMGGVGVRVGVVSLRNRLRANRPARALAVYNAGSWRSARGQRYAVRVLRVQMYLMRLTARGDGA